MQIRKVVPIIFTNQLEPVKQCYTNKLDFAVIFDSPGYLGLRDRNNPAVELGFMKPEAHQIEFSGGMLYLGVEVADVDALYERLKTANVPLDQPPVDNPWGDRSFTVRDPIGLTLYINTPIAPAAEYKEYYK